MKFQSKGYKGFVQDVPSDLRGKGLKAKVKNAGHKALRRSSKANLQAIVSGIEVDQNDFIPTKFDWD